MPETLDLNKVAEDIIASYEAKIENINSFFETTHLIFGEFQEPLLETKQERGEINSQLEDLLAKNEHLRRADFNQMMQGVLFIQVNKEKEIRNLKKIFGGKFIITKSVKEEIVDKPLTIKRFELEAMMIQQLLDDKILEMPSSLGIDDGEIVRGTQEILGVANNIFYTRKRPVHLIDAGEASCLALGEILNKKKIESKTIKASP